MLSTVNFPISDWGDLPQHEVDFRAAAIIQPPSMRNRWKCLLMGQAAGVAAALAAKSGVTVRNIDVKELQRVLFHHYHTYMGEHDRLKELGLVS